MSTPDSASALIDGILKAVATSNPDSRVWEQRILVRGNDTKPPGPFHRPHTKPHWIRSQVVVSLSDKTKAISICIDENHLGYMSTKTAFRKEWDHVQMTSESLAGLPLRTLQDVYEGLLTVVPV